MHARWPPRISATATLIAAAAIAIWPWPAIMAARKASVTMRETDAGSSPPEQVLAAASWLTAKPTRRVFDTLEHAGFNVRAVGGTVRNTLLGEPVSDIDLAVDASPQLVMAAAKRAGLKVVPTGIAHGTITIVVDGTPFEVTSLRQDVATDGRRATVAYTSDWNADAERRDFTINAIYCDRNGVLFDPVGGLADIAKRRVRFIGDAHARIREDYLRILRFFRFSAQYAEGVLDPPGLAACINERAGLQLLSAERVRHEFLRLLEAPSCAPVIACMEEHGFIVDLVGTKGNVAALAALIANAASAAKPAPPDDAVLRLAALAVATSDEVAGLKVRLRLSNAEAERIALTASTAQSIGPQTNTASLQELIYRNGNKAVRDGIALAWARHDATNGVDTSSAGAPTSGIFTAMLATAATWSAPALPIAGRDLIARGIPPGPRVRAIIDEFERWWIEAGFPRETVRIERKLAELVVVTNR